MPDFDINAMPQFNQQLMQINAQRTQQDEQSGSFDDRFLYFKPGNNYRFRLCWPVDPSGNRKFPFIFGNVHSDIGTGRSGEEIVCPTSDYISGKAGFRQCRCCAEASKFYQDYDEHKNQTSYELYKHFKRKSKNIAIVYVISDGLRPENNGKFMLARFAPQVADYIRRKVFGWALKKGEAPLDNDQIIGQQAFLMDNGIDMIISVGQEVTQQGTFNSYNAEFLPKPTQLPVTQADVNKAAIELKFDEDFYKLFDPAKTEKFVKENVLGLKLEYEVNGAPVAGGSGNTFDPTAMNPNNGIPAMPMNGNPTPAVDQIPMDNSAAQSNPAQKAAPIVNTAGGNALDNVLADLGL